MKGHIRERSPGHWAIVLDTREPATGKRKRRWHSFRGTKRQAQSECARLITEVKGGTSIEPHKATVAAFLDRWLEHMESQVAPRTIERYAEIGRKNIVPLIGSVLLTKLQPATISGAYAKALAEGRRNRNGGLSPRTVGHMHRILRQCLKQAVDWNLLGRNPADSVKPPKVERKKMRALTAPEAVALLEAIRPTRMFVPVLLALT
jgi:integrase